MYSVDNNKIYLTRGDNADFTLTLEGYEAQEGDVLTFTVKKNCQDKQALIQKTLDAELKFTIEHDDTKDLQFGDYWYDVQLKRATVDENDNEVETYDTVIIPHVITIGGEVTW